MAERSETVLNDWAAGFTAREIEKRQKIPLGSVTRYIVEARRAGDPRAALRNGSRLGPDPVAARLPPSSEVFGEIGDEAAELPCQMNRDEDAAALAALIKVHGEPSRVSSLRPAPQAFQRPDAGPPMPRGTMISHLHASDPPPGRSALDLRRAG